MELLVSLTGGLFVSLAVFALARDASRFYQREGRLANATLAGIAGFERLRADIARAGFLSTPNIQADPAVCARPGSGDPAAIQNLASVQITSGANAAAWDSIQLTGSYSSPDEFPVRAITQDSGSVDIALQTATGPMARLGYDPAGTEADNLSVLSQLFRPGRLLRIVDNEGRQHYGVITSITNNGGLPIIGVAGGTSVAFRPTEDSQLCGLKGLETGATVNVVNIIRYDLRSLAGDANYAALYPTEDAPPQYPYDANRQELVRTEIDGRDGSPLAGLSPELVAEYAVDLQFDLTAATTPAAPAGPGVTFVTNAVQLVNLTNQPTAANARPQDVRAVRVRLAVRSREADRETDVAPDQQQSNLYRIGLGANNTGPFARVRTLQSEVMLNNHSRLQW